MLTGLPRAFELLFDEPQPTPSLLPSLLEIYAGDWAIPEVSGRPYVYSNFVQSRDGRVSFSVPGRAGGGDVSGFNQHDQWLMGLLRARADAVVMGDTTLKIEPEHLWTCEYIYPSDPGLFLELRQREKRAATPLQVFLSLEGDLHTEARVFSEDVHIIVATTTRGAERAKHITCKAKLEVLALGDDSVDIRQLCQVLHSTYQVKTLLCEGGPRTYGSFIAAHCIDEEFLTLAPTVVGNNVVGNDSSKTSRPGLIEGVAFMPDNYPTSKPVSLRRAGDHLFLRSRYEYPKNLSRS
jgi:riboflavin biosynthesis pyrimidine reductase